MHALHIIWKRTRSMYTSAAADSIRRSRDVVGYAPGGGGRAAEDPAAAAAAFAAATAADAAAAH